TVEEVIKRANATKYGLASGVFTKNIDVVNTVSRSIRAGAVWVNCYLALDRDAPHGGAVLADMISDGRYSQYPELCLLDMASASSHLNNSVNSLSENFHTCMYPSVSVDDGHSMPVTNTGHSILPTPTRSLHLNNVLITPHIVKNLIYVRQFVRDNNWTIKFDAFGFSVKDFLTRRVLHRCDSTRDLYPVTVPSPMPHASLLVNTRGINVLDTQGVKCYVVLFLLTLFRVIKRSLPFFVMLVSLENT
nr:ribonuclease H-like domain-containing protein [Tanacetum cinerariifolium]